MVFGAPCNSGGNASASCVRVWTLGIRWPASIPISKLHKTRLKRGGTERNGRIPERNTPPGKYRAMEFRPPNRHTSRNLKRPQRRHGCSPQSFINCPSFRQAKERSRAVNWNGNTKIRAAVNYGVRQWGPLNGRHEVGRSMDLIPCGKCRPRENGVAARQGD